MVVTHEIKTGITIAGMTIPEGGGSRPHRERGRGVTSFYGGPLIIVDFGTATTFCAITRQGRVPGRSDYAGDQDFRRSAVPAGIQAAAFRAEQAG